MGIKNSFEAAEDFTNSFKSGGTLDQITSAQQNRSVKKADKVKTKDALDKFGKLMNNTNKPVQFGNFRKIPARNDTRPQFQSQQPSYNNNNHQANYRRFTNNNSGGNSNSGSSNTNNNSNK